MNIRVRNEKSKYFGEGGEECYIGAEMKEIVTGRGDRYKVYESVAEAMGVGIVSVKWREGVAGDWVESDDGWVVECLKVYSSTDKELMKFSCGRMFRVGKQKFMVEKRVKNRAWNVTNDEKTWRDVEIGRKRVHATVAMYVNMLISGKKIDWVLLGNVYRPEQREPILTVKRLIRMKEIQEMVKEEIKKIMEERGMGVEYTLGIVQQAIAIAREKRDASNMLRGAESLIELNEMRPERVQQRSFGFEFTGQLSDGMDKAIKELEEAKVVE